MTPRVSCPSIPDSVTTANKGFYSLCLGQEKYFHQQHCICHKFENQLHANVGSGGRSVNLIPASEPSTSSTIDCYMLNKPTQGWGLTLQPLRLTVIQMLLLTPICHFGHREQSQHSGVAEDKFSHRNQQKTLYSQAGVVILGRLLELSGFIPGPSWL